jgi:hypothetical protein
METVSTTRPKSNLFKALTGWRRTPAAAAAAIAIQFSPLVCRHFFSSVFLLLKNSDFFSLFSTNFDFDFDFDLDFDLDFELGAVFHNNRFPNSGHFEISSRRLSFKIKLLSSKSPLRGLSDRLGQALLSLQGLFNFCRLLLQPISSRFLPCSHDPTLRCQLQGSRSVLRSLS